MRGRVHVTVGCPPVCLSVCLSVCPVDRQKQRCAAGLVGMLAIYGHRTDNLRSLTKTDVRGSQFDIFHVTDALRSTY